MQHVRGIADIGNRQWWERWERLGPFGDGDEHRGVCEGGRGGETDRRRSPRLVAKAVGVLVQREEVGEDLSGVPEGGEGIDDGDGGVFCESLEEQKGSA